MVLKIPELDELVSIVVQMHDAVLAENQVPGLATDKSLESVLARPYNRVAYGLVDDVFDLAACFTAAIIHGHAFNDGNKRTALMTMELMLNIHDIDIDYVQIELADQLVLLASGQKDESGFAKWLRHQYSNYL